MLVRSPLPASLWTLILLSVPALGQSSPTALSLDTPVSIANRTTSPLLLSLPASSNLTVSIALCVSASTNLRFFLSNASLPGPDDAGSVQLALRADGLAIWTGLTSSSGATLALYSLASSDALQIAVSDTSSGAFFDHLPTSPASVPLFGDTTANQALLFSPPFARAPIADPSYPNYSLPSPQAPFAAASPPPADAPRYTLLLSPTNASSSSSSSSSTPLASLPQTACALARARAGANGTLASAQAWLRRVDTDFGSLDPSSDASDADSDIDEGWRTEWLVEGLAPGTNYTAYAIRDARVVGGPVYFVTKSAAFSCPLVHALPYCPSLSHAVPLPFPSPGTGTTTYTGSTLPAGVRSPLLGALSNFSTALGTFACGRDAYSPLRTCAQCARAYARWLCAVSLPRCAEPSSSTSLSASSSTTSNDDDNGDPATRSPTPALSSLAPSATPRNANLAPLAGAYFQLLPCLETCTAADRACPNFLGFKCPVPSFNANDSYGVGYIDGGVGMEDVPGAGVPGVSQDVWGNVWCDAS